MLRRRPGIARHWELCAVPHLRCTATRCSACGTHYHSATTLFLSTPIPLISISHTSPTFLFDGTPSVPIHITSPGMMVQYLLT